jgi:hypothetical protein
MNLNWESVSSVENLKLLVSFATLVVGIIGGVVAYQSFRRTEIWKKAEFLANAMKEFFADERVKKTLLFIDWGVRKIQLLPPNEPKEGKVIVDRLVQARALRPHVVPSSVIDKDESDINPNTVSPIRFRQEEVAIRDCYDGFLDGLETFASYAQTSLVETKSMNAYIGYWLDNIQGATEDPNEAAWKAALLTYISYYKYPRVIWLFAQFGYDIKPSGATYLQFLSTMQNQQYASALARAVKVSYP